MSVNIKYMQYALDLAQRAIGNTSPNPMVGCVIVKDQQIVGQGYHQQAGQPHAEVNALQQAGNLAQDSTMYVTLEPCAHFGRTPPCVDKVIASGIKKIYIAMVDPNPLVAGKSVAKLKEAGITVEVGLLQEQASKLNEVFIKWILTKRPFVVSKLATSLDGKIATKAGQSKWITNEQARQFAHQLRSHYDAILVGVDTIIADDPLLTCRLSFATEKSIKQPIRLVLDSTAKIGLNAKVLQDKTSTTIVVTTSQSSLEKRTQLEQLGVKVLVVAQKNQRIDLMDALKQLAEQNIQSILVEGGARINAAFYQQDLVDKIYWIVGNKILGGKDDLVAIAGSGIEQLTQAVQIDYASVKILANNLLIQAYPNYDKNRFEQQSI